MNDQVACVLLTHGAVVTRECISLAVEAADSALLYKFAEDHHELLVDPLGWPLGCTPLHMACDRGSQDLVSSTVNHMCSISVMPFTSVAQSHTEAFWQVNALLSIGCSTCMSPNHDGEVLLLA